jgi:hypothetical protein
MPSRKFCPRPQPLRTSRDLSLGFCPPEKYALEYASIPQISLFGAYATPQNQPITGPVRTSRDLSLRISITRKICPRTHAQTRKFRLMGHMPTRKFRPRPQPVRTSRDLSLRISFTRGICPRRCPKHAIIQYSLPKIPPR